jgi:hypothetical protein
MIPQKRNQLSGTVTECVAKCISSGAPLTALAAFLETLRAEGWSHDDVHAVESAARKLLAGVIGDGPSMSSAEPE